MDILIAGGAGSLVNDLTNKLNKEGHRIYILTGNRFRKGSYGKVFEKYYFPYDCDCINEILDSVNPDVIIFTGAFDLNFDWNGLGDKEAVRFSAGLVNILMAFSKRKKGRFIFLSSDEVYALHYDQNIEEEELDSAVTPKGMALAQGEDMCMSYARSQHLDVAVLRLDKLYHVPKNRREVQDICSAMCLSAVEQRKITINGNHTFSLLHQSDAVQFIYLVVNCREHKEAIYNISSSDAISSLQLAKLIQGKLEGEEIEINNRSTGEENKIVLSNRRFDSEFGIRIIQNTDQTVAAILDYMKKHRSDFVQESDQEKGFLRRLWSKTKETFRAVIPFAENLLCFIPFFMLNNRAVGSDYFANLDFYLLYVLLFAIVYGQHQAVFSALLAVAGYCFRQMYTRSGFDVLLDYNTYVWIGQLFILGLVVGYMRDQIRIIRGEGEQEMGYLNELLDDIQDINTSNVRMKNVLETQVVNQNDSFGKIYEITASLEQYVPEEVLFYAAEVLSRLVNSKDVAIYTVANRSYARLFSSTSAKARELGNSINYTELGELYDALVQRKVYINKQMDERYPLMANAIYSEDEMQLIVMVWGIPWERMTLGEANMLVVVSYLIQNAVVRANRYLEALEYKRYVGGTQVLETEAFSTLAKAYLGAKEKDLTQCTILEIENTTGQDKEAAALLNKKLRQSDYLGMLEDGKLYALLSNTSSLDAEYVIKRFKEIGYYSRIREDLEL